MKAEDINRLHWDELAPVHYGSYRIDEIIAGRSTLKAEEIEHLGDVQGQSLLHLQCHIGTDTLGWARAGARVTGVDLSPVSIEHARKLFTAAGAEGTFVARDLNDLETSPLGEFDVVYTSRGVLCWLRDLDLWGRVIAKHLKPGGRFYVMDAHPVVAMFQDSEDAKLSVEGHYFRRDEATIWSADAPDYANPEYRTQTASAEWDHSLADILGGVRRAGLETLGFWEHDRLFYDALPGMEEIENHWWVLPEMRDRIPLSFELLARKPA
jgi:SAM-dependent methyltransferase